MINNVILMGRLTADPQLKTTQSGKEVCAFCIAIDRPYLASQQKIADFIPIVAWQNTAVFVCNYFKKGSTIAVIGRLQSRKYTLESGENRTAYEVVATQVSFCGSKAAEKISNEGNAGDKPYINASAADFEEITDDEDLPF